MATENFQFWASEINKDWDRFDYSATATDESVIVYHDSKEVARIDYNNGRYTVTGTDEHAVEQLEWMINR